MGIYYYCRTSPTMGYHGGAARSCSSFADPEITKIYPDAVPKI
jgi:hypothetical protein